MEENENRGTEDQGIIKTLADPNVLAEFLDKENSTEFVQNSGEYSSDNLTEETLNEAKQNDGGNEGIFGNNGGDLNEWLEDSLEIKSEAGDIDNGSQTTERSMNLQEDNPDDLNSKPSSIKKGSNENRVSVTPSFRSDKERNSAVINKQQGKQKPKIDFIDQNKGNFSRKPGKVSYAAIYSQKLKLKQGTNGKISKAHASASGSKEKENRLQQENDQSYRENLSLEQYDKFNESFCSFSLKPSNSSTYRNVNKGLYYNVDTYNVPNIRDYGLQSSVSHMNQSLLPESYLNQPYRVPSRGFGLRYSNYGHQSYQSASAMTYPQQSGVLNTLPGTQLQGYESQSAPPGGFYYQRRPLIDQVEFFPDHEHFLSQSLTNSQFINPQQLYPRDSVLERVSEPQLSNSPQQLSSDRVSKISRRSNSNLSKPVDFKPYTLKDYRQIKNENFDMLGSLGPNTESEDYKEKITKLNKQRQYAEIIRLEHAARKKQWEKKAAPPPAPARQLQAEAKRQAAINYSKTVPKPKVMESTQPKGRNQEDADDEEEEVTILELLKMRHEQEKNKVQALRKEITSKPNS